MERILRHRSPVVRTIRIVLVVGIFLPFYVGKSLAQSMITPFGLTAERGKIEVWWRDVLPLDGMAVYLDARRADLARAQAAEKSGSIQSAGLGPDDGGFIAGH